MSQPTFTAPDLDTFCMVDALGLTVTGQHLEPERAVLQCRVREDDPWCRSCGGEGIPKGTVLRKLAHVPLGDRKSTRLNSSHVAISYAVFCLKKNTTQTRERSRS